LSKHRKLIFILVVIFALFGFGLQSLIAEPPGIPVLNYHQINDVDNNSLTVSTAEFTEQMDYLQSNGYTTITSKDLADALEGKGTLPDKPVMITFDDGYLDNYTNALPILHERNMKAIIFIITDYVGLFPNYVTWDQMRDMQKKGIEFGSHTLSHVELTKVPPKDAEKQLKDSSLALAYHTGKAPIALAYPCGRFNDEVLTLVKNAGYRLGFTVELGFDRLGDNPLMLQRVPIFGCLSNVQEHFEIRLAYPGMCRRLEDISEALEHSCVPWLANLIPLI